MPARSPSSAFLHRVGPLAALLAFLVPCIAPAQAQTGPVGTRDEIQHGRYLVKIGGCNDCHTPGYAAKNGEVDEKLWLTGDKVGWSGPWGTTYPANLRLLLAGMSQEQWITHARAMTPRPPMPWFNMRAMTDADLKAIYQFTRSLGTGGEAAPAFLPPGSKPAGPVIQFPG
jgi:mono/diheme cytochrome c family protein